jgi:hypothetical protein
MSRLSAVETGLTGWRFIAANPRVVAVWAGIYLVISVVFAVAMVVTVGPAMTDMMQASAQNDPAATMAQFGRLAPAYAVLGLIGLGIYAIVYAATARAILRPERKGTAYLEFGGDELRQLLLMLLSMLVVGGAYVVIIILAGIVIGAGTAALGPGLTSGLLVVVGVLAGLSAFMFLVVRLSLASALTFDRRRVNLFGSWKLTRGVFWPLLGGYLIAALLCIAVSLLVFVISAALAAVAGGGFAGFASLMRPDMSSLRAYFTPTRAILTLLGAVASAVIWPVFLMPPAGAYAQLVPREDIWD